MYSRRPFRLVVTGATVAAVGVGLAVAGRASASVTYDPDTKAGFVAESEVRKAFGWTGATLAVRASGLVFDHDFWTDDTYSVSCGLAPFPVVHHEQFGRFELTDAVVHAAGGYGRQLAGFRLTGARSGISGTSVAPMVGQPCPDQAQPAGSTVVSAQRLSSSTGWALAVTSGDVSHRLVVGATPTR
ncbi:hypothetical protein ACWKSP_28940 [Micromonosporaceae bacterium Da 78-11]